MTNEIFCRDVIKNIELRKLEIQYDKMLNFTKEIRHSNLGSIAILESVGSNGVNRFNTGL